MPRNNLTDDPNIINEIELNCPPDSIRINYLDFHDSTSLSGPSFTKDSVILNGLKPSYCYPETIKVVGHWRETGFIAKLFVIKTTLNTIDLLNKYLKHLPTFSTSTLDCAMYDYFLQVELKNGFESTSRVKTNRKAIFHLHRGFSRHSSNSKWYGDWYGTISEILEELNYDFEEKSFPNSANTIGVYEQAIKFGFNYTFKGVRSDNTFTNPYMTANGSKIPPLKYLDIYETLQTKTVSEFEIVGLSPYQNYKPINRIASESELPPSFNNVFALGFDYDELYFNGQNKFTFELNESLKPLERATYSLNFYVKTIGQDGRAKDNLDGIYKYQQSVLPALYSNNGRSIIGYFDFDYSKNLFIQNRNGLNVGRLLLTDTTSSSLNSNNYYIDCNDKKIICRYDIFDLRGSGFSEVTDKDNSTLGMFLSMPKKLRLEVDTHYYDQAVTKFYRRTLYADGYERIPRYKILLSDFEQPENLRTNKVLKNAWYGVDSWDGYSAFQNGEYARNFNTFTFLYDLGTFIKLSVEFRNSNNSTIKSRVYIKTADDENKILKKFKNLITVKLMSRNENFEGRVYNPDDDDFDSDVYFRGKMNPAFVYNRLPNFSNNSEFKDKLQRFIVNNAPNIAPQNSSDPNNFINLNAYRFLNFKLTWPGFSGEVTAKVRFTLHEPSGLGITQRYFDRTYSLYWDSSGLVPRLVEDNIDLLFPDFPGQKYDTQDDPYPRLGDSGVSENERKNSPYFGCSRVLRIDINSNINNLSFDFNTSYDNYGKFGYDILRFNPPSGIDSNLRQYKTDNSNVFVRRLLYLEHSRKPEEEFDFILDKSISSTGRLINISEFVDNLNKNHFGLTCRTRQGSENILATYAQGHHFYLGKSYNQAYKIIDKFFDSADEAEADENNSNLIYYSDIYQGIFLDFPPYIQDFFETYEENTFVSEKNYKRKLESSDYHLICKGTCSLRSVVAGGVDIDAANALPRRPDLRRSIRFFEENTSGNLFRTKFTRDKGQADRGEDGFYKSEGLGVNYEYNVADVNNFKNGLAFHQFESNYSNSNPNYNDWTWNLRTRNLPNKLTRVFVGQDLAFNGNPYLENITFFKNFFTAIGSKIDNQTSVILGDSYDDLSPFPAVSPKSLTERLQKNGSCRVVNLMNTSTEKSIDVYDITSPKFTEFYPRIINQNLPKDTSYILLSESYKFPSSGTGYTSQGIVYSNLSSNNLNSWSYYRSDKETISRLFRYTERNSYQISPNFQDIYALGEYRGGLLLQVSSLDNTKSENGDVYPNNNKFFIQVDGVNTVTEFLPEVNPIGFGFANAFKYSSLVCVDTDVLVMFYSLVYSPSNIFCNKVFFRTFINNGLSSRNIIFESKDFCTSENYLISNYDFIFDNVQKLIKCVFLLTTGPDVNNTENHIMYTEFDFNSGTIIKPTLFHYLAGNFDKTLFKENVFYQNTSDGEIDIPYHKPAIYIIENNEQKGSIGIFYKNNKEELFQKIIKFYSYTSKAFNINGNS